MSNISKQLEKTLKNYLSKTKIYFNLGFVTIEKRNGFFEQQLGIVFLNLEFLEGLILAFRSGIFLVQDTDNKITPVSTNERLRKIVEFIV